MICSSLQNGLGSVTSVTVIKNNHLDQVFNRSLVNSLIDAEML